MTITSWPRSMAAWQRTSASLAGGVSTGLRASMKPHPIFFSHGEGATLTDLDGNTYVDYVLGWGPVIIGHAHPALTEAITRQAARGLTFGSGHLDEAEAAEAVLDRIPGAERVLWSNTGSEANQVALRIARSHTGRQRFVKFRGHYHGWTDAFLLGYRPRDNELGLGSAGQSPAALEDVEFVDWGDLDALAQVLADNPDQIAAIFLEPVLINSGLIEAPEGFLKGVRELCDQYGIVLIFDEVITGFRIARGGAVERFGVTPDLIVMAKAIAGGLPLAAVAGKQHLVELVTSGTVHAGTYNGNPLVLAGALATLTALDEDGTYEAFERRGRTLAEGLRSAFAAHDAAVTVHQVGPVVQIIPAVADATTFDKFLTADQNFYDLFTVEMLRRGHFLLPGGRLYISTAHTDAQIDETVSAAAESLAALQASTHSIR